MIPFFDPKALVEQATASLEAEVGRFLILKESILKLPASALRDSLMAKQNALEAQSMKLMSDANDFKTKNSGAQGLGVLKLFNAANLNTAKSLAQSAAATVSQIQAHKANVAQAVNGAPAQAPAQAAYSASGMLAGVPPVVKAAVALGAAAFAVAYVRRVARRSFK